MTQIVHEHHFRIKDCRYGRMMYSTHDTYIGRSLDQYGEWCEHELHLLRQLINQNSVVLDVGANVGTHTLFFAKHAKKVFAFEPQKKTYDILCKNISLNNVENVECIQKAVGSAKRTLIAPPIDFSQNRNFGAIPLQQTGTGEEVEVITIDSLNLEACRLIKIDVEGMETAVLLGAQATIKRCKPLLYVENNDKTGKSKLIPVLMQLGYVCYWHITPYYNENNFFNNEKDVFNTISKNMICFPASAKVTCPFERVQGPDDTYAKFLDRLREKISKK